MGGWVGGTGWVTCVYSGWMLRTALSLPRFTLLTTFHTHHRTPPACCPCDSAPPSDQPTQHYSVLIYCSLPPSLWPQDAADLLPALGDALGGINLPTIPLVNFDLDSVTAPVVEASDTLEAVLSDGGWRRVSWVGQAGQRCLGVGGWLCVCVTSVTGA